jgi:PAS domain S-box-containing protein
VLVQSFSSWSCSRLGASIEAMGHDTVRRARSAPEGELLGLPFAANTHPMWVVGRVSQAFLDVNNTAVQQYGYSRQESLNITALEIRPKADTPELLRQTLNLRPQGPSTAEKWRHQTKNGAVFPAAITGWELTFQAPPRRTRPCQEGLERPDGWSALQDYYDSSGDSQYLAARLAASPRVTKEAKCGA